MSPLSVIYTGTCGARTGGPNPWVPNVTEGGVGGVGSKIPRSRAIAVEGTDSRVA